MKKIKRKMVGVVLLNYNNASEILACIENLRSIGHPTSSIIVVDNHSTDDSFEYLKNTLPADVTLLEAKVNGGFGMGNNIGISLANKMEFEYLCVMNSDVIFHDNFLKPLTNYLKNHPEVGLVGPCVCYTENNLIASCGGKINFYTGKSRFNYTGTVYTDRGAVQCDYLSGGCVVTRMSTLRKVGMIPEQYFLNYEDNEWSINFIRAGFKVVCLSSVVVFHDSGSTIGSIYGLQSYFMARNRILFERRNAKLFQKIIFYPYLLLVVTYSLFSKKRRHLVRAYLDGFTEKNRYQYLIR
ncbi:glycosyltransferase family 2 protein [Pediococcus ethanolidurans]|uniref:glycosyltransferase family 2 protein n=1 Tax=Pediococcus ethanolidurans TaxID=319653 RepID=UPI0021E886BB|nr:glycosyltransferase family 2 protein [Pediococcus ethanolidurans]MCV3324497.1 glycosyltransferase family 2 protein [Pediococcus ethanolidurans]